MVVSSSTSAALSRLTCAHSHSRGEYNHFRDDYCHIRDKYNHVTDDYNLIKDDYNHIRGDYNHTVLEAIIRVWSEKTKNTSSDRIPKGIVFQDGSFFKY
jgi:hypothetical protein